MLKLFHAVSLTSPEELHLSREQFYDSYILFSQPRLKKVVTKELFETEQIKKEQSGTKYAQVQNSMGSFVMSTVLLIHLTRKDTLLPIWVR